MQFLLIQLLINIAIRSSENMAKL